MKTIQLRCNCGKTLRIRGKSTDEIIIEIDRVGWSERPGGAVGWMPATCPTCADNKHDEDEDA